MLITFFRPEGENMFIAPMIHFQKARSSPLRLSRVVFDLRVEFRIRFKLEVMFASSERGFEIRSVIWNS